MTDKEKDELRKQAERYMRTLSSKALYNNLVWWADGSHEVHNESLQKALYVLDEIFLNDFRDEFVITIPKGQIFLRARVLEDDDYGSIEKGICYSDDRLFGFDWENSKEPPAEIAQDGRTSYKGEPALYLASDEITACTEVKPEIRQMVSVAKFISEEDVQVIDFSKLKYSRPLDVNDVKYDADAHEFLQNVLALFTQPVYGSDYRVTQKIVEHFREKGYKGFAYRSFYTYGINYTFFDENMKKFRWEDSRVLLNYSTANLFVSMDKLQEHEDIRNISRVEQIVDQDIKDKLFVSLKRVIKRKY